MRTRIAHSRASRIRRLHLARMFVHRFVSLYRIFWGRGPRADAQLCCRSPGQPSELRLALRYGTGRRDFSDVTCVKAAAQLGGPAPAGLPARRRAAAAPPAP